MTKQNITNKQYSFVRDRFNRLVKPCYRYKAKKTKSDFKEYQKKDINKLWGVVIDATPTLLWVFWRH